jgi:hypothetical protein
MKALNEVATSLSSKCLERMAFAPDIEFLRERRESIQLTEWRAKPVAALDGAASMRVNVALRRISDRSRASHAHDIHDDALFVCRPGDSLTPYAIDANSLTKIASVDQVCPPYCVLCVFFC